MMIKFSYWVTLCTLLLISEHAQADVLIDLENSNEISINNTQPNSAYSIKLIEPTNNALPITAQIATHFTDHKKLPFNNEVIAAANITALSPALIHAVIATESQHNPFAKSHKGAFGLMQLMPATAQRFNVQDKNNTQQNILAGAQYLKELLTQFNGNLNLTLAAYNAGPAAVIKYGGQIPRYKETQAYVPKVLRYYRQYSAG